MALSTQSIFNRIWKRTREQGKRSLEQVQSLGRPGTSSLTCRYRGVGGLKCGIGHVIPDEIYDPQMEGQRVGILLATRREQFRDNPKVLQWFDNMKRFNRVSTVSSTIGGDLWDACQRAHDYCDALPEDWVKAYDTRMTRIAKEFGLEVLPMSARN